jgi:hypothetical protein
MASAIDELGDCMVEIVEGRKATMASAIDELGDCMVEIVDKCEERGMQVPFIVCVPARTAQWRARASTATAARPIFSQNILRRKDIDCR